MDGSENKRVGNEESTPTLPHELITEILSWLPVKHLSQVQLVSKEWQASIHNHYFIEKHMAQSPILKHWHNEYIEENERSYDSDRDSFSYMHGCDGVVLIMNRNLKKYILWNPAIFRAMELPDPHAGTIRLSMLYVPASRDYRIVSIYHKDKKPASGVGCEVLTPGPSMSWKPLAFPDVLNLKKVLIIPTGKDVHCVLVTKDGENGAEMIVTLDVEAETFTINHLGGVFDVVATAALNWDGKLGFARIVGETLETVKLEDYKKQKWSAEKTIIPLPFVNKPGFQGSIQPLFNRQGDIWFWLEGKKIFYYNLETCKIVHVKKSKALSYESEQIYSYKQSLLSFEGMQPDKDKKLDIYRPRP